MKKRCTPASRDYKLFLEFIETYETSGFQGISREDPLMMEMEEWMEENNQFFFVGDLIKTQILFTSQRSQQLLGIEPENLNPYHLFEATHPDDIERHNLGRTQLFKIAHILYTEKNGEWVLSANFRLRNPDGEYTDLLFQCYFFHTSIPFDSVILIEVHTPIEKDWKIKDTIHYYSGNDLSNFRYPDKQLLSVRPIFTEREFEIIRLIHNGLDTDQISEKLFLSKHTIQTHRKNILTKGGKTRMSDIIYDLVKTGLL
jgi:DNA-binding CsgD family transcriptional regulator